MNILEGVSTVVQLGGLLARLSKLVRCSSLLDSARTLSCDLVKFRPDKFFPFSSLMASPVPLGPDPSRIVEHETGPVRTMTVT